MKSTIKPLPVFGDEELQTERRAFERQRTQLLRRYAGEFVALSGGRVVAHDKDDEVLAAAMFRKFGDAPFYIAFVADNPMVCDVPSPELAG